MRLDFDEATLTADTNTLQTTGSANQFLSFRLDGDQYAVPILKVQEIRGYTPSTPIPNAPAHVKGVINLRGTVVPVIDLRIKFSRPAVEYDKFTVIVVVSVADRTAGLIVDAVSDVLDVAENDIREAPELSGRDTNKAVKGLICAGDELCVLLDIDELAANDIGQRD